MKKLNYIDVKTGEYVTLNCELNMRPEEVINRLSSIIYLTGETGGFHDQKLLAEGYDSVDFIGAIDEMLSQDVVDASKILMCSQRNDKMSNLWNEKMISSQAREVIVRFFEFFDYTDEERKSPEEYTEEMYFTKVQGVFGSKGAKDAVDLTNAFTNNTKLFMALDYVPYGLQKEREEVEIKHKSMQKVIPFVSLQNKNKAKA